MAQKITPKPKADVEAVPLKTLASDQAGALTPHDSVETAGERMRELETATLPVVDNRKLVGMVQEENPDCQIGGRGHDPKQWKVRQIMSRDVVFCYEDEDCTKARELMDAKGLRYLPVVDREMRIIGIFSREEIIEKESENLTK